MPSPLFQTASGGSSIKSPGISYSGRVYAYADDRWVTDSDDNYGPSYYQWAESGGTGADPTIEWEHNGHILVPGQTVKSLTVQMRTTNTLVSDCEIYGFIKRPNPITRWETGYDNDSEDVITELIRDSFWNATATGQPSFSGNTNDKHRRHWDFTPFVTTEHCELSIFFKPTNGHTSTLYIQTAIRWGVE